MNTNCLEGMSCPHCGNEGEVHILATSWFHMYDSGTSRHEDVEYDVDAKARCPRCGYLGSVGEFRGHEGAITYAVAILSPDVELLAELALNKERYPDEDWEALEEEVYETECVRCSRCESTEFRYEENASVLRTMAENRVGVENDSEGLLVFNSGAYDYGDGDNEPGVVCAGCNAIIDTKNIRVDWT